MKRFLTAMAILPVLAACSSASVTYDLTLSTEDEQKVNSLLFAAMRVIERRMANIGEELLDLDLQRNDGVKIFVKVDEQAALDVLTEQLTLPFTLRVMKEIDEAKADMVVEGHGGFAETGINGEHIVWLQASEEQGGKGRVTIIFSEEGRELMAGVFEENVGKHIGIFVRDQLVSKLLVEIDELKDDIIITDIPTVSLANVFADDVNVGLHITFTPNE